MTLLNLRSKVRPPLTSFFPPSWISHNRENATNQSHSLYIVDNLFCARIPSSAGFDVANGLLQVNLNDRRSVQALHARQLEFVKLGGKLRMAATSLRDLVVPIKHYFGNLIEMCKVKAMKEPPRTSIHLELTKSETFLIPTD